jgi:2-C-methyl-D-erythritol 4-phosphate cytidylyltransferase
MEALSKTDNCDLVCIHDSARPLIDTELVRRVVKMADQWEAAVAGVQVKSTIKLCDASQLVINTLDRSHLWEIQTPQVIRLSLLKEGIRLALDLHLSVTDDVSLIELLGKPVKVVEGSYANVKITTPEDIILINQLIERNVLLQAQDCL